MIELNCTGCGKVILKYPSEIKEINFCSSKCYGKYISKKVEVKCVVCGKVHYKWESAVTDTNLCSKECKKKYLTTKIQLNCDNCGEIIFRYPTKINKTNFCNHKCQGEYNYKMVETQCLYCGSIILIHLYEINNDKFCNKECCDNYKIGKPLTEECRQNMSVAHNEHYKNHPETGERISASHQRQNYDEGEWTGYVIHHSRSFRDCIFLNEWFSGCDRHHITKTIVVCIPRELHRHIHHNLDTGFNMGEINMLALQYLYVVEEEE